MKETNLTRAMEKTLTKEKLGNGEKPRRKRELVKLQ
jgi:hypothetical protein